MTKDEAVHAAAVAVIEHGGPACLTDPHISLDLMCEALTLGATHSDIAAELQRIRETEEK